MGTVAAEVAAVRARIGAWDDPALFIGPLAGDLDARAEELDGLDRPGSLHGLPFVVKDNIDVAGMATTAACRAREAPVATTAAVVRRMLDAGAVVVGKVNLDQFATGLVGTRSPYGTPRNVLDAALVPGGSSSGSATAVAAGIVPVALGTDTAGSGRVPAAMNQVVGLKPTRGIVSTAGVVPACASLDCVSVFAATLDAAAAVLEVLVGDDPADPWRRRGAPPASGAVPARIAIPDERALAGVDGDILGSWRRQVDRLVAETGVGVVEIDLEPFLAAGRLLYGGPFVAERLVAAGPVLDEHPDLLVAPVDDIVRDARRWTAVDLHLARRAVLARRDEVAPVWRQASALVVPSVPRVPTLADVAADPVGTNTELGTFTTFANLLDLCAITVPDDERPAPGHGATLLAPAGADRRLLALAGALVGDGPSLRPRARPSARTA